MFHRWFAAARSTRHRRLTLQRKEDQMKLATITFVWDKWRDQFISEKLQPMVIYAEFLAPDLVSDTIAGV